MRRLAHRVCEVARERRPRFGSDLTTQRRIAFRFLSIVQDGTLAALLVVLPSDVTPHNEGGGKARSMRNPVFGVSEVARLLAGVHLYRLWRREFRLVQPNGQPDVTT